MSDRHASRNRWILVIGILGIVGLAMIARSRGPGRATGVTTIDYGDVVRPEDLPEDEPGDTRPVLHMAAGAMVSPKKTRQQYDDLMRVIADRVGRRMLLAQRKTYAEINAMVEKQEVDVAFVCSAPYVAGKAKFGMEILVVPVVYGRKTYHSYILAHRDSDLNSFDDMRGKVFVFTDPNSNSGCLVPKYMLSRRGETPQSFFASTYNSYSHDNSIRAVAEQMADGAAVDSLIWRFMQATDATYTSRTKIVEESPPFGIPPVVVHPDLDSDLKGRLKQVFLTLHQDENSRSILRKLHIDRFEEGDDTMYDSVREMTRWLASSDSGGR